MTVGVCSGPGCHGYEQLSDSARALPEIGRLLTKKLASEWAKINRLGISTFATLPDAVNLYANGLFFKLGKSVVGI